MEYAANKSLKIIDGRKSNVSLSETQIQAQCVIWFKNEFRQIRDLLYMVHNDGKKNAITASQDLARGLTKGIPDLSLDVPNGEHHGLKIELKKPGEKPRPEQVRIHALMQQMGYRVELIDNVEDFKSLILSYLPSHLVPEKYLSQIGTPAEFFCSENK